MRKNIKRLYRWELNNLMQGLMERGIDFRFEAINNGGMVTVLEHNQKVWDAVCHDGSYGHEEGSLEVMGTVIVQNACDDVDGWLTADEILERVDRMNEVR